LLPTRVSGLRPNRLKNAKFLVRPSLVMITRYYAIIQTTETIEICIQIVAEASQFVDKLRCFCKCWAELSVIAGLLCCSWL